MLLKCGTGAEETISTMTEDRFILEPVNAYGASGLGEERESGNVESVLCWKVIP